MAEAPRVQQLSQLAQRIESLCEVMPYEVCYDLNFLGLHLLSLDASIQQFGSFLRILRRLQENQQRINEEQRHREQQQQEHIQQLVDENAGLTAQVAALTQQIREMQEQQGQDNNGLDRFDDLMDILNLPVDDNEEQVPREHQ